MANTITATYSFTLPEVGADTNAWGGHINGNFSTIDAQMLSRTLATAQTMVGALALPSNGLNVGSGQLNVTGGNVSMSGSVTAVGNLSGANGVLTGTLNVTGATALGNTLLVNGAVTFDSTLAVSGAATFSSTGFFAGAVTASTAPTVGGHLTNKTYVDNGLAAKVATTRSITAGTGLTGGGTLAADRTISIATGGVTATLLASNAVTTAKITDANVTAAKLDGAQSGSAPIFGARAWGRVDASGTLSYGGNVASASRTGTGIFAVTFTTAMANTNYAVVATVEATSVTNVAHISSKSTTGFGVYVGTDGGNFNSASFSFIVIQ